MAVGKLTHLGVIALLGAATVTAVSVAGQAATGSTASALVPITPCRLMDTRPGLDNVGPRATPLGPGEAYALSAWGKQGKCTIPNGATGLSLNVAIVNPTAASFLTVFGSGERPLAANLNWVAGQAPTPNAVTTPLTNGVVTFFNFSGTVDLVVDVNGYYQASTSGPAGPAGPAGEPATPFSLYAAAQYELTVDGCASGSMRIRVRQHWGADVFPDAPCRVMPLTGSSEEFQAAVRFVLPMPPLPAGLWTQPSQYLPTSNDVDEPYRLDDVPEYSNLTSPVSGPALLHCVVLAASQSGLGERAVSCRLIANVGGTFGGGPNVAYDTWKLRYWSGEVVSTPVMLLEDG